MGLNSQLAIANRERARALLEASQINETENFVKNEFLIDIKGVGVASKTILINNGINTIEQLKEGGYKNINLPQISIISIDRYLEKLKREELEKEIETKTEEAINGKIDENVEVIELEENLFN